MSWLKTKIQKLQNSDERTKLRWAYVLTAIFVIVVFTAWSLYQKGADTSSSIVFIDPTERSGFFLTLKAGAGSILEILRRRTASAFLYFQGKFNQKNTYKIESESD